MEHKDLIDFLKKSDEVINNDLFGEKTEETNPYELRDKVYNQIIDDYTLSLIDEGLL